MRRNTPLQRGTPLVARTGLQRRSAGLTRSAHPARRSSKPAGNEKGAPVPASLRADVLARDGYRCVGCDEPVTGRWYSLQHRLARGMGGRAGANTAANLVTLCGSATSPGGCHSWAESHPAAAAALGFVCPSWADPTSWPVLRYPGRWEQPGEAWTPAHPHPAQAGEAA